MPGLREPVVAAGPAGGFWLAGLRGGAVELRRTDRAGRLREKRTLGHGEPSSLIVAAAGRHVAVAWLDDVNTVVLARGEAGRKRFSTARTAGAFIGFHALAMNARGVAVDAFRADPGSGMTGIGGLVAAPGRAARRIDIAPPQPRMTTDPSIGVDARGAFHAAWTSEGLPSAERLGRADGTPDGAFAAAHEDEVGSRILAPVMRTAADGGQIAAFERRSGTGEFLLSTTRRAPGGPWEAPVVRARLGNQYSDQDLSLGPGGDAVVTYGSDADSGLMRVILLPAGGPSRTVSVGRGGALRALVDADGRARLTWRRGRDTRTALVSVRGGAVGRPRVVTRGCAPDGVDDYLLPELVGAPRGRWAEVVACNQGDPPKYGLLASG